MDITDKEFIKTFGSDILSDIFNGKEESEILLKYGISSSEFSKLKNILILQVKSNAEKIETTSHAIRYFKNLSKKENGTVFQAAEQFGLPHSMKFFLYKVLNGDKRATYGLIFRLRTYISPSQWVYSENEQLPEPVKFTPLIEKEYPEYNFDTRNELAQRDTLGNIFFNELSVARGMRKFCAVHNANIYQITSFVFKKHHKNGTFRYVVRPTLPFIKQFRDDIHPDWWFIYPEEVPEEYVFQIKQKAHECVARLGAD